MRSMGSMVIEHTILAVSCGMPMLVPLHSSKGNVIAMSHDPENLPLPPILADIPRGKSAKCATTH